MSHECRGAPGCGVHCWSFTSSVFCPRFQGVDAEGLEKPAAAVTNRLPGEDENGLPNDGDDVRFSSLAVGCQRL